MIEPGKPGYAASQRLLKMADSIIETAELAEAELPANAPEAVQNASNVFTHALYDAARELRRALA